MKFFEHLQSLACDAWPAEIMVIIVLRVWHKMNKAKRERERLRRRVELQLKREEQHTPEQEITKVRNWAKRLEKEQGDK